MAKRVLLITSSGGGGLIQTANAKEQQLLIKDPSVQIIRRDLLKDWVFWPIGSYFIRFWNGAQRQGNVAVQVFFVWGQFLADLFLHPIVLCSALYTLFQEEVDHIIDTQPLCTSALLKAIRIYNWKRGKQIRLEKVVVDLPTKRATHFFRSIKKLPSSSRRYFQLTSIPPFLEEGETAEEFWQSTCGLSAKEVNLEEMYVRQAFLALRGKKRDTYPLQLRLRYKNGEELALIQACALKGSVALDIRVGELFATVQPTDRMITILLGSQPSRGATLSYVKKWISFLSGSVSNRTHLFVFCADHKEGEKSLLSQVAEFVEQTENYPKHLSIIPFSFQEADVIAPLFQRSDITCTRSGGQTAMELMCVSTGEIWIHSEAKEGEDLLKGIPGWEAASAICLQKLYGAHIVTPELMQSHAHRVFQIDSAIDLLAHRPLESTA